MTGAEYIKHLKQQLEDSRDDALLEAWATNYVHTVHNICTLCGNHGYIDTRGLRSPAGVEVGAKNYCICPNGRALRKIRLKQKKAATKKQQRYNRKQEA